MRSLRVLVILLGPPLPFGSAPARSAYVLIRELTKRRHRITAFISCKEPADAVLTESYFPKSDFDLRFYSHAPPNKIRTLQKPYSYMFSPKFYADLEAEKSKGYDVLHLEELWSAWAGTLNDTRSILNLHNLYSLDLRPPGLFDLRDHFEQTLIKATEARLLQNRPFIATSSPRLNALLAPRFRKSRVVTLPLGIELSNYPYVPDSKRSPSHPIIGIIGSMKWAPMLHATERYLERIWPSLKKAVPELRTQIVGWNANSALKEYFKDPKSMDGITVHENVPDISEYFNQSTLMLYPPELGSGMKVKVMEAFGYGVPVVTTSEGIEGIPAENGVHATIDDTDAGLISKTLALLKNPSAQNAQRKAARSLIEGLSGPTAFGDRLESIYEIVVRGVK